MTTHYESAHDVIADRTRWARACLGRLVKQGRDAGWLAGEPIAAIDPEPIAKDIATRTAATPNDPTILAMEWLRVRLGLDAHQHDALWLLACCELDPAVAHLAQAFGAHDCPDLSVQLLSRLVDLSTEHLDRLVQLALIETTTDPRVPAYRRWIRATDRILELARGELGLDREIGRLGEIVPGAETNVEIPTALRNALIAPARSLIVAVGAQGSGRATLLRGVAALASRGTLEIRTSDLARDPAQLTRQLRAIGREAALFGVVPVLREVGDAGDRASMLDSDLFAAFTGPVLASATESPAWLRRRSTIVHQMQPASAEQRKAIWAAVLPGAAPDIVDAAAARYAINPGAIVATAERALARAGTAAAVTSAELHDGLRDHLGKQLGTLATRIDWRQTWDDLVLPADQFEQIIELVARVRHRRTVLEQWGFGDKVGKGHGVTALFSGPPGTGKTMVAGLIALELGLDLYQVDLSRIVSKYIGETEKNLAVLFDAAESGHSILLFDEADSLFAKRSEVKSSNDRYANLEVNYLLQRLESFRGISLLTTNHETSIDDAFRRRLALHVRFPMPDDVQREQLWRAMLPSAAPTADDLDLGRLAREFEMSGGYVKNAVLRAAYFAADEGSVIRFEHLWRAARAEYEALGKVAFQRVA